MHCFDELGNELGLPGVAAFALLLLQAETRRAKQIHNRVKVSAGVEESVPWWHVMSHKALLV